MAAGGRRAVLVGVPHYEEENIGDLPVVRDDVQRLQEALESSGYQVDAHCPTDDREVMSIGKLRRLFERACLEAEEGETLLLYFSGHGGHFGGRDCLVPGDACLDIPESLADYLLPVDFLLSAAGRSRASTILYVVDACREGLKLDAKAIALSPWSGTEQQLAAGRALVTLFGCDVGQFAQFSEADGYSLFSKALAEVLHRDHQAVRLGEVIEAADRILEGLWRTLNKSPQRLWVRGEGQGGQLPLDRVICDGPSLAPAQANPWLDAVQRSRLWERVCEREADLVPEMRAAVEGLVALAWQEWLAAAGRLPPDPWRDSQLPVRVTVHLAQLVQQLRNFRPGATETALLLAAPFVRETVLCRGVSLMAEQQPLSLTATGSGSGLRAALEAVHNSFPRLLRKAERLNGREREILALWFMHRALLREPRLWLARADSPNGLFEGPLAKWLAAPRPEYAELVRLAFGHQRLLELARALGGDLERVEQVDRPHALGESVPLLDAEGRETQVRERSLAYLLLLAGAMALDPRLFSEVLVEHLGLSDAPDIEALPARLADTRWHPEGSGRSLTIACDHPALDYSLREHVDQAADLLMRLHAALARADRAERFEGLPTRLSGHGIAPQRRGDTPAYETPHVRFRLAHDEVMELLMGEQLYGDPTLAIRELYQNALDACRYAQARLTYLKRSGRSDSLDEWEGRITFRQEVDPQSGRTYIECEDNGIGMGHKELADCFAFAGRRFAETPEYLEEAAEWLEYGVELFPNSQFGIGVLSYFMLADELVVETRRMDRHGRPGEALRVTVAGSGSLFRIQKGREEAIPRWGTRVRLYLKKSHISCLKALREVLWVAEFSTLVSEQDEQLEWKPGELRPYLDDEAAYGVAVPGELWWAESGRLLSDGLYTETKHPVCVVNLRERRRPSLTIDRKKVRAWNDEYVGEQMARSIETAVGWSGINYGWLAALTELAPVVADWLVSKLNGRVVPVKGAWRCLSVPGLPIGEIGFLPQDVKFLDDVASQRLSGADVVVSAYSHYPVLVASKRLSVLGRCFRFGFSGALARRLAVPSSFYFQPSDGFLVSYDSGFFHPIEEDPVSARHLFELAAHLGIPVQTIAERLQEMGFDVQMPDAGQWQEDDRVLLSRDLDGLPPFLEESVAVGHLFAAADKLGQSEQATAQRLNLLGLQVPMPAHGQWSPEDRFLLSDNLDGNPPWLSMEVSVGHLFAAADRLALPVHVVRERLRELGFDVPDISIEHWGGHDRVILSHNLSGRAPWLVYEVPVGHVFAAAEKVGQVAQVVAERLRSFGLSVPLFTVDHLEPGDRVLLSQELDGKEPWLEEVFYWHLFQAADLLDMPIQSVADRLREFGLNVPAPAGGQWRPDDRCLLFDADNGWLTPDENPVNHLFSVAEQLALPVESIAGRLRSIGFEIPSPAGGEWQADDCVLLSQGLDGKEPWLGEEVPVGHLFAAAERLDKPVRLIAERLGRFGLNVPNLSQKGWQASDRILLSRDLDGEPPWIRGDVPVTHLFQATEQLGQSVESVAQRMRDFGWEVECVDELSDEVIRAVLSSDSYRQNRRPAKIAMLELLKGWSHEQAADYLDRLAFIRRRRDDVHS